jgi:hypothetical protein
MDLHWLKPLLGRPAPFTTVYLDATPTEGPGEQGVVDRWRSVRRELERDGAPASVLDEIAEVVAVPTWKRGPHGRVVVADAEGVRVDRVLSEPPAQSQGVFGPAPALLPAVRAADDTVRFVVVAVDRSGADLTWVDGMGRGDKRTESVEGGHDEIHKTREGMERRAQTRAEDSWSRNAEAVAGALDRSVAEHQPELVVLTGDLRAVALVREAVDKRVSELLVEVPGGGRGEGIRQEAFEQRLREALDAFRMRRRAAVLDRFAQAIGQGSGAVTALDDVVDVLRRGQVDELVLHTGAVTSVLVDRQVWVGPDPLQLGVAADDLAALGIGASDAREMPVGVALVRAALAQDAGVTFAEDGAVELVDGVGAVLRWSDGSTPSESVLSQSADTRRVRGA